MDAHRAKEIFDSLGVIEVVHKNSPVWIEKVEGASVEVRYLDSDKRARVPVFELSEPGG